MTAGSLNAQQPPTAPEASERIDWKVALWTH
jgi:hypothetical protein